MGASMNMGGGAGGRRGRRRPRRFQAQSEINVTPFVDVMLVLLIIFMVSAPLLTVGVPIDLPESAANPLEGDTDPLTISIEADGTLFLQEEEMPFDAMMARLQAVAEGGYDERILVRGDTASNYGAIMRVMGQLNAMGYNRIGLVTVEVDG